MKGVTLFLVLSLVVLMAEPGDAIFGHIFHGIVHAGRAIHRLISGGRTEQQRELQDQALYDREREAMN